MKKYILITFLSLALSLPWLGTAQAGYLDIQASSDYREGVHYLELQGAINDAEYFNPQNELKRGELFKILFKTLGEDGESTTHTGRFTDVPEYAWFMPFAELALDYGLVSNREGNFNAEQSIRRIDALKILMKAYGMGIRIIPEDDSYELFADVPASHPFYLAMQRAYDEGLIQADSEGYWHPYRTITRGEFADLIFQFDSWETVSLASDEEDFHKEDIFADVWNRVLTSFYLREGQEIDEEALFQAAVKGMIQSLNDPFSSYLTPSGAQNFNESISGETEGVGAVLHHEEETNQFFIVDFTDGSPAQKAGVQANDEIIEIDGLPTAEMSLEDLVSLIKGESGTDVTLTIKRGNQRLSFTITRAPIRLVLESVEVYDRDLWLFDLNSFAKGSSGRIEELFEKVETDLVSPKAIVIDLRGNGGGYLSTAKYVTGLFLEKDAPLMQMDYGFTKESFTNTTEGPYANYPLFVLVDSYSASASEILAATLQEQGATIIGTQSYGKGTVQQLTSYWDDSTLKITIAEWLSGKGTSINGVGVTPDININWSEYTKEEANAAWLEAVRRKL